MCHNDGEASPVSGTGKKPTITQVPPVLSQLSCRGRQKRRQRVFANRSSILLWGRIDRVLFYPGTSCVAPGKAAMEVKPC